MPLKPNMVDVQDPRAQSPEEDLSINNSRNQFDPVKLRFVPHSLKSEDDVVSRGVSENKFDPISLKFVPRVVPAVKVQGSAWKPEPEVYQPPSPDPTAYYAWIDPSGTIYDSGGYHGDWVNAHYNWLKKKYKLGNLPDADEMGRGDLARNNFLEQARGWVAMFDTNLGYVWKWNEQTAQALIQYVTNHPESYDEPDTDVIEMEEISTGKRLDIKVSREILGIEAALRSSDSEKYWIAPDGHLFDVPVSHVGWIFEKNPKWKSYDKDGRLGLALQSHDEEDEQEVNEQQYYQVEFVDHGWTKVDGDSITTTKAKLRVAKDFVRERWLKDDREKEIYVELADGGAFQGSVKEFMRWGGLTASLKAGGEFASTLIDKMVEISQDPKFFKRWRTESTQGGEFSDLLAETLETMFGEKSKYSAAQIKEASRSVMESQVETWLDDVNLVEEPGGIRLWRAMTVEDLGEFREALKRGQALSGRKGIGVYWSYDKDKAEAFWGEGGENVLLSGVAPLESIDFVGTADVAFNPGLGTEEAEIRLKAGAPILVDQLITWEKEKNGPIYSEKIEPINSVAIKAAFDEDRNKPQQDKIGVHRDFITETNYGGQPDKITQGWDGVEERSMKEFYYAPGSGAFLARLIAEYPDYFGNRSEDQISQNPSGYDDHVSDSTEYGPRKFPHHDKDVRLDRLPKDQGYPKTGFPEPLWSVDILDNGENTYPLRARQALISLQAVLEKEKVTNEDQAFTVSYERDPNNPKAEAFAVVQDLYDPEPVASAPFLYLRHSKSGKWEQSGGAWKAIGPNWPEGRLNEVLPWILSHVPEKLETAVAPKAPPKKEKPTPKNSDNKGQEVKKIPKDADAIERVLFQIKPSDFVADVFFGNLAKASEEIRKLFEGRPTGDGNYFRWKVFNNNNLMVTRKV